MKITWRSLKKYFIAKGGRGFEKKMTKDDKKGDKKDDKKSDITTSIFYKLRFYYSSLYVFVYMTGTILTDNIKSNKISRPNARSICIRYGCPFSIRCLSFFWWLAWV